MLEPAFHGKGVALRVEIDPDVPMVWADAEKIHQVLLNLLTNALAATPEAGEVVIHAEARPATPDEAEVGKRSVQRVLTTMVTVAVSDTGCGMPDEDRQKAFTPFFTTKAIGKGTGLGLFLSRETAQAHGGNVSIESEVGKGTTVVLSLPGLGSTSEAVA